MTTPNEPGSFDAMAVWREAIQAYVAAEDDSAGLLRVGISDRAKSAAATVIASAVAPLLAELAAVKAERDALIEKLHKANKPHWFYHPEHTEVCQWSPHEVVDEYYDPAPGDHVFEVECARPLPSIWCAVRVTADEDADERFTMTEHATEEEARQALGASHAERDARIAELEKAMGEITDQCRTPGVLDSRVMIISRIATKHAPKPSESDIVERLRSSAKAFREHNVYDSEGDPVRLIIQADECDKAATTIEALRAENERLRTLASSALQLLEYAPEINPSNYDHDQVCALNTACVEVWTCLNTALQGGQSND